MSRWRRSSGGVDLPSACVGAVEIITASEPKHTIAASNPLGRFAEQFEGIDRDRNHPGKPAGARCLARMGDNCMTVAR